MRLRSLGVLIWVAVGWAQPIRVYSEFQRIDPFGEIIAVDRAESPREILSPALARGTWSSFFIAVQVPLDRPHTLFIGQNPENFVRVKLFRAVFVREGGQWVPDALEPLTLYPSGKVADAPPQVPGQTTLVYWMDIWVSPQARVERGRIEVQVRSGDDDWTIYPLELRVLPARLASPPGGKLTELGKVGARSSESAKMALCGDAAAAAEGPLTVRSLIRRNARQDVALARNLFGVRQRWCGPGSSGPEGAEWYLQLRADVYRTASEAYMKKAPMPLVAPPH